MAALPLVFLAIFTDARGWALIILVALGAIAAISFGSPDSRQPEPADTERFLIGLLVKHGYSGAFRLHDVDHVVTPGSGSRAFDIRFKAALTITEPLYQTTVPSPAVCGDYTPRRIAILGKVANQLAQEARDVSAAWMLKAPVDPYLRPYVASRSQQGWVLEMTGTARATHIPRSGWQYFLTSTPAALGLLAQTGRPRGAFFDAVVLDASDGAQWLVDTMQAWATFEADLVHMRATVDELRAHRGQDLTSAFFASIWTGLCFAGTGETKTQKSEPRPFVLEITAIDAAKNGIDFTLRPDHRSPHARHFTATVEVDDPAGEVRLVARTEAMDAMPDGGPLLNAATAFTLDFRWAPDRSGSLVGTGADFALTLQEPPVVEPPAIAPPASPERQREVWNAVAPGLNYAGMCEVDGRERKMHLTFVSGTELGSVAACVKFDGWSGLFRVAHPAGREVAAGFDLLLEAVAVPAPVGAPEDTEHEPWQRLLLRVADRELAGAIESASGAIPVRLER